MKELMLDNIFDNLDKFDTICVTTNGCIKSNGRLVMGKGIAKEFKDRYVTIDTVLGNLVNNSGNKCYFIQEEDINIISFPTKNNWRDKSDINLIKKSCLQLVDLADKYNLSRIALPRPGCSNGWLDWKYVKEEIKNLLDDRFTIFYND
jgi:hypothetical protein